MKRTPIFLTVLSLVTISNHSVAQSVAMNGLFQSDAKALSFQSYSDTSIIIAPIPDSEKFHLGFHVEGGDANPSNFQIDLGFDVGMGDWVIQGDYRSYGGNPSPAIGPNTSGLPWFRNGSPTITLIPDLLTSFSGINEYSLTAGKVIRYAHGTIILMPTIGLAAVSRNYIHYSNCSQVTQPGTALLLFIPVSDTQTWYQYNTSTESEVNITIPLSLHAIIELSSWIGLSFSGWTEIGNGGTSGWSAGLEIGALP
jgi:hypothetical protein